MGVTVSTVAHHGQTVVSLEGVADSALLARVVDGVTALCEDGAVVLDLTDVALSDPDVIAQLVSHIATSVGLSRVRVVCPRLSARKLLRRFGDDSLVFYSNVAAALTPPVCA